MEFRNKLIKVFQNTIISKMQIESEVTKAPSSYKHAEDLIYLLEIQGITQNEETISLIFDAVKKHYYEIQKGKGAEHYGFAWVCLILFNRINDDSLLELIIPIIKTEEANIQAGDSKMSVTVRNLIVLMSLNKIRSSKECLLQINLLILKLISDCFFIPLGISLRYLSNMALKERLLEERLIICVFEKLGHQSANNTFLYIAKQLNPNNSISKATIEQRFRREYIYTTKTGEQKINLTALFSNLLNNKLEPLKPLDPKKLFPGIQISKQNLKERILSNDYYKVLLILNQIPGKKKRYFQHDNIGMKTERENFLLFVKELSVPTHLRSILLPMLALEETGRQMLYKATRLVQKGKVNQLPPGIYPPDNILPDSLNLKKNIRMLNIELNPLLKTYIFTFENFFVHPIDKYVLVHYNFSKKGIVELPIDGLDVLILQSFNKDCIVANVIQNVMSSINHSAEEMIPMEIMIKDRIQFMITDELLF